MMAFGHTKVCNCGMEVCALGRAAETDEPKKRGVHGSVSLSLFLVGFFRPHFNKEIARVNRHQEKHRTDLSLS